MKNKLHNTHTSASGFTLLFSVLVATLVVAIGATIVSISIRQTILSGTSRESQYAFYAANTALECAHYWDTTSRTGLEGKFVFPAPGTNDESIAGEAIQSLVTCSNVNIITGAASLPADNVSPWSQDDNGETTFYLKIKDQRSLNLMPYEYCAEVLVRKVNAVTSIETTIEAKGYNTCDTTNPRRVERGLVQYYES